MPSALISPYLMRPLRTLAQARTDMKDMAMTDDDTKARERRALRDKFAMAALTGLLANPTQYDPSNGYEQTQQEGIAYDVWNIVDWVLSTRGDDA